MSLPTQVTIHFRSDYPGAPDSRVVPLSEIGVPPRPRRLTEASVERWIQAVKDRVISYCWDIVDDEIKVSSWELS